MPMGLSDSFSRLWPVLNSDRALRATQSSRQFHKRGFCVNRLWNLSSQSRHGIADVPHIAEKALELPIPKSESNHANCTEESCLVAHENGTLVQQAHKCPSGLCNDQLTFPPAILNKVFTDASSSKAHPFEITAWRVPGCGQEPSLLCTPSDSYVAISHVWSDGTGVGLKSGPGIVNSCLFQYFSDIAKRDEVLCNGIWWDTISIPTERHARAIAMDSMLENYEKAKVTVVHDKDLLEFEWSDDGSPAVAIVLSSWFTRGWTAGELWASRHHPVKVLFKDLNDSTGRRPLIKDLDMDILARDLSGWFEPVIGRRWIIQKSRPLVPTDTLPGLAHMIATDILALFRWADAQRVPNLQALLRMLRTRTTSWARDRTLTATLMCLPRHEIDSTTTVFQMTQKVLTNFEVLRTTEIVHHQVSMSTDGPWDWAPHSIFDLGQWSPSENQSRSSSFISWDGSVRCEFMAYEILQEDVITEYRHHPALAARISVALSRRQSCLLLTTSTTQREHRYVLFQPVSVRPWEVVGRWIGCVSLENPLGSSKRNLQDCNIMGLTYVLGKSRSSTGRSLPAITFKSTYLALDALSRDKTVSVPNAWCLSTSKREESSSWPPQPVYIYKPSAQLLPNIGRTGPIHPSATAAFSKTRPDNWILSSFLSGLIDALGVNEASACPKAHDGCDGIATITWSFPCLEIDYHACWSVVPLVYTSVFHVTSSLGTLGRDHDMVIGADTFDDIKARFVQTQKQGTYVQTCSSCGKCGRCARRRPAIG